MLMIWIYTLSAVFIVSLVSLVGIFTVAVKIDFLKKILMYLVSLSAGALLGGAFFHLIPEAIEESGLTPAISFSILLGIIVFMMLERAICWRHCHIPTSKNHPHPFAFMNLIGDAFHNFIDGMIIAGSFLVSVPLGITTTIAVIFHEIPQEIGDFGVLVYAGFGRVKALMMNFVAALSAILGAIIVLLLNMQVHTVSTFLVPFTAGGFIYIASSDLIPEMKKESEPFKAFLQIFVLAIGLGIMYLLVAFE